MYASLRRNAAALMVGMLLGAIACSKSAEPLKIAQVDLTHEVDEHNEPRSARETFAPTSTIYASIAVEGTGPGILTATWTDPSGQVIADQKQDFTNAKPTRYEFHIPPAKGEHPLGRYHVTIALNGGKEAGATKHREFEIRVTQ
ncbi:MAG: hypothetical protein B6D46_02750 [Polyangiaceae bacterium UTPRO1]|jgi:hypothetical protein|nr:hypothetical protein [Myxococcales bacterium]OQY68579.1 MAG: hypothetical protein B6D46_02750 [Polyangiaceae bacterium UTPRO1]